MSIDWASLAKGVAGELSKQAPSILSQVLAKTNMGDLQSIVNKLQEAGLNKQVASWLSNSQNIPVTKEQLRSALNDKQLQQIARSLGVPVDQAVDQASPNVQITK